MRTIRVTCPTCGGTGAVAAFAITEIGFFRASCRKCYGAGYVIHKIEEPAPDGLPAKSQKEAIVKLDFEPLVLVILGTVITASDEHIDKKVDEAADAVVKAIKSSDTLIDDTVGKRLAVAITRLGMRVEEGINAVEPAPTV